MISETSSAITILIGFTGRPLDESTGLQKNWNRWYDAESGRWPSEDPIGFAGQDANLARYVGNSPVQYVDPNGLRSKYPSNPYNTKGVWWAAAGGFANQLFSRETASTVVGFVPVVGSAQSAVELVTGKDYITGQPACRASAGAGIVLGALPAGKALGKNVVGGVKTAMGGASQIARKAPLASMGRNPTVTSAPSTLSRNPTGPVAPVRGGRYTDVRSGNKGGQVHHMPASAVSPYTHHTGPSIWMCKADHKRTASWGSSAEAAAYRQKQADLIEQGKLKEAIQMDIDDIQSKFGNKYDENIRQMLDAFKGDF